MIEYNIPKQDHIEVEADVPKLFLIAISAIGNIANDIIQEPDDSINIIKKENDNLKFSSIFFDAYLNAQFETESDYYFYLFGSIAYFFNDYIGNSKVLINKIDLDKIDFGTHDIERALVALLQGQFVEFEFINIDAKYAMHLKNMQNDLQLYYSNGTIPDLHTLEYIRRQVYEDGSDIEVLLVDALCAIYILKIRYSAINLLPRYMNLSLNDLNSLLFKSNIISELWPSQRLLGELDVYSGRSAVIQMPTSSGKTKSISLIIASAFLANKTNLAIIVAPYRALCREISTDLAKDFSFDDSIYIDELSDILQEDELLFETVNEGEQKVLVATPEKLIYILRKNPEIIDDLGLIIFDEGHLFDDPTRGTTYELLISTIKTFLAEDIQKIIISAVISNAKELNNWFTDANGAVISGNIINSTHKSLAITDWKRSKAQMYGYLYFVNPENPEEEEFFVPRLISIVDLEKKGKERKLRRFPEVDFKTKKVKNNDIAINYALTLSDNGGVAIFCGSKIIANSILKRTLDLASRNYSIASLLNNSEIDEVEKISRLIALNYGIDNDSYKSAKKALFVHHAGISTGIKIAIEHAMREEKIKVVVCTSTLSQGVNLPIKYLVVTNIYQSTNLIKVRDFHNLLGRAGRAGIHTEGTILFTETFVYNQPHSSKNWKWTNYKNIIDNNNSEPCSSRILFLVQQAHISPTQSLNINNIVNMYYTDPDKYLDRYHKTYEKISAESVDLANNYFNVLDLAIQSLEYIESFLLTYLTQNTWEECKESINHVIKQTLAYSLANDIEKEKLLELFQMISQYCIDLVPDSNVRYIFSKSLLGIKKMIFIKEWASENVQLILECKTTNMLYDILIECIIDESLDIPKMKKLYDPTNLKIIGAAWINGMSYMDIWNKCKRNNIMVYYRNKPKLIDLDDIILICDNILSYNGSLIVSALSEVVDLIVGGDNDISELFKQLATSMKYGISYGAETLIYEMGFSDRVVSQVIANYFHDNNIRITTQSNCRKQLKSHSENIGEIISIFPSVFIEKLLAL